MFVDILLGSVYALVMVFVAVGTLEQVVAARRNATAPVPRRPTPLLARHPASLPSGFDRGAATTFGCP
jgi:hypothetical protein